MSSVLRLLIIKIKKLEDLIDKMLELLLYIRIHTDDFVLSVIGLY